MRELSPDEQMIIEKRIEKISSVVRSIADENMAESLLERAREISAYVVMYNNNYRKGVRQLTELLCLIYVLDGVLNEPLPKRGSNRKQDSQLSETARV